MWHAAVTMSIRNIYYAAATSISVSFCMRHMIKRASACVVSILQVLFTLPPLSGCRDKLDSAHSHAAPYEEALQRLFPWIPDTLSVLEGLGACPTEPEAVEERKNKIEVCMCLHSI